MKKLYFFFRDGLTPFPLRDNGNTTFRTREEGEGGRVRTSLTRQPSEPHNLIQVMGSVNITNDA